MSQLHKETIMHQLTQALMRRNWTLMGGASAGAASSSLRRQVHGVVVRAGLTPWVASDHLVRGHDVPSIGQRYHTLDSQAFNDLTLIRHGRVMGFLHIR